eukprot:m.113471 g.113471  ORF g.113471 m.113471 type:complete len:267 (+) comp13021_c0_seq5:3216-4016(+)
MALFRSALWWLSEPEIEAVVWLALVHAATLWLPCALFAAADRWGFWSQYRLPRSRPDMAPTMPANMKRDADAIVEQIVGTFVVVPIIAVAAIPMLRAAGIPLLDTPGPPTGTWVRDVALMVLGCDTLFYFTHRALHHPWLYAAIHKKHHEYKATNVWASEYFGVIDLLCNVMPGVVPALLLGSHFAVFLTFTALRGYQTVQSHAGYDLPFDPLNRGPFHGGARRHDFHHSHNVGCYGDWTPFWDWMLGTDVHYTAYCQKRGPTLTY